MIYPKFVTKYIAFTQYFSNAHQAVDIANAVTVGGKKYDNKDVFLAHDAKIITNTFSKDYGYFVEYEVKDGNDTYIFADGHFDDPSTLEVGKTYPQGTFIHKMGNTGDSQGIHDHHRLSINGKRVNPLDYEYVYPDQSVGDKETANLKHYTPEPTPAPTPEPAPQPTVDLLDLVRRTIRGDFGNGQARKNALGDNYAEVQRQVNLNYSHGTTSWSNVRIY